MENKKSGVYQIVCFSSGKCYVGSSVNIRARWASHRHMLRANKHGNRHLQNSFNKHGPDGMLFEVIEHCSPEDCITMEQSWIDSYPPNMLMNSSPTATTRLGFRHGPEALKIISEKAQKRGAPHLVEHCFKKGTQLFLGKSHTPEAKEKMRKIALKRGVPAIAGWNAGIPMPPDVRAKVSVSVSSKKVVYSSEV